jgi:hypothetical protein
MKTKDIKVGTDYAVKARAKDIPEIESLRGFPPYAAVTKGRALSVDTIPGNSFVLMEVEFLVAKKCPACHQGFVYDEEGEIIIEDGTVGVLVKPRNVLGTWEAWKAETAERRFNLQKQEGEPTDA